MTIRSAVIFQDISKDYDGLEILSTASGKIMTGSLTSLIGPNGCGKSTLLKILVGIIDQTSGTFSTQGSVSYVPQKNSLMPWLTVQQNLEFADKITKSSTPGLENKIKSLLKKFKLDDFADHYPAQLSGGMQQKLSIISAILRSPEILLLDEPFSSLDAITRRNLQKWLLEIWQEDKMTVLCVTHDIREAIYLSDTILAMTSRPGSIVAEFDIKKNKNQTVLKENEKIEDELEKILLS